MSEFKKTLTDGTPGALPPRPDAARAPRVTTTAPPLSHLYEPPAAASEEARRTAPSPGVRVPPLAEGYAGLPPDAPGWMVRARRLAVVLEASIAAGGVSNADEASIERAWAAWELEGATDRAIAKVVSLVDRARTAIRDAKVNQLERVYNDCAQVLWASLPREIKARQDSSDVLPVMRELRDEADPWTAVVSATAQILGWQDAALAHAAHAIRIALLTDRTS
jgi:hypothetical protein